MKGLLRETRETVFIVLGIFSAAFGLKGFLLSSRFIDGGVTGVSMLISDIFGVQLALLILIINLPFIALGFRQVGIKFAIKSALAIGGLSACLAFVKFPDVTPDKLLTAVFGGFFIGAGIGMAIRGGAVLDGTEIAALLLSRNSPILKVGDIILVLNIVIFSTAAFFLGVESALYSILTYFAASKTIDFLVYGIEEYHGLTIVSPRHSEIRSNILHELGRGVTVYQGYGGLKDDEKRILYCVVTRLEIPKVRAIVESEDPEAFIVTHQVSDVTGGIVKRRNLH